MIQKPTVFILGAGASVDYGYPTSAGLTAAICRKILKKEVNIECLQGMAKVSRSLLQDMADHLSQVPTMSIDRFLEINPQFQTAGKILIAHEIMSKEGVTPPPAKDWYTELWVEYLCTTQIDDVKENKVAFITFNYDRSLEHFLLKKIVSTYRGQNQAKIEETANAIEVIHVHGQVGFLPWQKNKINNRTREYGEEKSWEAAVNYSDQIKIISQVSPKTPDYERARERFYSADRIHFLGFGYHEENLQRLRSLNDAQRTKAGDNTWGSSFGLAPRERAFLESSQNPLVQPIHLADDHHENLAYIKNYVTRG